MRVRVSPPARLLLHVVLVLFRVVLHLHTAAGAREPRREREPRRTYGSHARTPEGHPNDTTAAGARVHTHARHARTHARTNTRKHARTHAGRHAGTAREVSLG